MEEVRGWTPAAREKIKNRVRARKKTVLRHIEAGDVEEYSEEVLNKRANAIINPMPSASRAVGRVKETHAEAVVSSKAKTCELPLMVMLTLLPPCPRHQARRAGLNIPADATPAERRRIMMKSARDRDKTLQKPEWHEARRLHHLAQKRM